MTTFTMGLDQLGNTYHDLGKHPRKALLARLGRCKASKMFVDNGDKVLHVGYVIGPHWITLFTVTRIERVVNR